VELVLPVRCTSLTALVLPVLPVRCTSLTALVVSSCAVYFGQI